MTSISSSSKPAAPKGHAAAARRACRLVGLPSSWSSGFSGRDPAAPGRMCPAPPGAAMAPPEEEATGVSLASASSRALAASPPPPPSPSPLPRYWRREPRSLARSKAVSSLNAALRSSGMLLNRLSAPRPPRPAAAAALAAGGNSPRRVRGATPLSGSCSAASLRAPRSAPDDDGGGGVPSPPALNASSLRGTGEAPGEGGIRQQRKHRVNGHEQRLNNNAHARRTARRRAWFGSRRCGRPSGPWPSA